jgi:hypothetical protein
VRVHCCHHILQWRIRCCRNRNCHVAFSKIRPARFRNEPGVFVPGMADRSGRVAAEL